MQFHLNGFQAGDPDIQPAIEDKRCAAGIDVLIVGCGPAGLTLAAQLAAFPEIRTRIVERKSGPLSLGQADGIACRTMEMFQAFGFAHKVAREAYWVNETAFWKPDPEIRAEIVRSGRIQDTEDGLSEFPHVILNQARVHDFYLEAMRNAPGRLEPDYDREVVDLVFDPEASDYPVTVMLNRHDVRHEGETETVKARYVVGCDGARSRIRQALGRPLDGDSANQAWGVMDVLAVTDFPDIRLKAVIHSANEGNVLIIPREGGYLVRLYIELDKLNENERVASRNITIDRLIAAANRMLHPYSIDVKEVAWWSVYEIGQRLTDKFDDVPEGAEQGRFPRVFIAGDACHTHSPKAGQGMNVSMQDTFNLGWKLAAVLRGQAVPALLHTYSEERRAIAKELIDFDREFARMFSAAPKEEDSTKGEGIDPKEFQRYFVKQGRFTAGTATHYAPSLITGAAAYQRLAEGFVVGMRFHSAPVIRLADAKPVELGHCVTADGRWRLFAFAAAEDPAEGTCRLTALLEFLYRAEDSPVLKHTPPGADLDSVIDVRAIFQQPHRDLDIGRLSPYLLPEKGRYGLRDYEKAFAPDLGGGTDIFDLRGIDRARGCMIVVRPDQYIAEVLPLDASAELAAFFDGFLRTPPQA